MTIKNSLPPATAVTVLRIVVSLLLVAHGCMRLYVGSVNEFGSWLNSQGFVIGPAIAWVLTLFEIIGGLLMAAGYLVRWVALVFIIELLMGIILVHAVNGWFVVGHQQGGVEYSVLLIAVLAMIGAAAGRKNG